MLGFKMDGASLRLTIAAMGRISVTAREAAERALGAAAVVLRDEAAANIGLTDHSLADLARIDHPYARRHGSIRVSALGHTPEWLVHRQSGRLASSLRADLLPSSTGEAWVVWFDLDRAPHAIFVVRGTRVMLPRDVLWSTATDPRVLRAMKRSVLSVLGKQMRTRSVVRLTQPTGGGNVAL